MVNINRMNIYINHGHANLTAKKNSVLMIGKMVNMVNIKQDEHINHGQLDN